jgi:F420-dependent oxidoreductase-like protein
VALGTRGIPHWSVPALRDDRQEAADRRLDAAWFSQGIGADALMLIGAWGAAPGLEVGTAVVPAQTRHPLLLAQQAATAATLAGPFTLGLGLGHRELLGPQYGLGGPRRVDWLREYLDVLDALLRGEDVDHDGPNFRVRAQVALPPSPVPDLLLAALGPRMLDLVAESASGTILWRTGPTTLVRDVVPVLAEAAGRHNRPMPRVVVGLPMVVTDDHDEARRYVDAAEQFSLTLPTYRDAYRREGVARPSDIALIGNEDDVREKVGRLAAAGATDLIAVLHDVGDRARTWDLLEALAAERRAAAGPAGPTTERKGTT